ncbi:hypothetical protein PENSPDRAFT_257440 [Peniophora sp. CONT]|nr:hypothetical protein PENSPDRAFT_257440 [Peniophora sp. CONT]
MTRSLLGAIGLQSAYLLTARAMPWIRCIYGQESAGRARPAAVHVWREVSPRYLKRDGSTRSASICLLRVNLKLQCLFIVGLLDNSACQRRYGELRRRM